MLVAIIDYGMGNNASVQKILKKIGIESIITNDTEQIESADFIILPGVGSFKKGMENLHNLGLIDLLESEVLKKKKPFLGICLGMQLLATWGNEPVKTAGLDWIEGEVIKIKRDDQVRIPHLGWNDVSVSSHDFYNDFNNLDYYFIHSYEFKLSNRDLLTMEADYYGNIVAGIEKDNIHAFQFHPEKSQVAGINLLTKIFNKYA